MTRFIPYQLGSGNTRAITSVKRTKRANDFLTFVFVIPIIVVLLNITILIVSLIIVNWTEFLLSSKINISILVSYTVYSVFLNC